MEKQNEKKKFDLLKWIKSNRSEVVKWGAFIFIIVLFSILTNGKIIMKQAVRDSVLMSALPLITVGCGTALIYAMGNDDFAVGGVVGFVAIMMMLIYNALAAAGVPLVWCILILIPTCALAGAIFYIFVWFLIKKCNLSPVFASLSTMFMLRGIGGAIIDYTCDANHISSTKITDVKFLDKLYTYQTLPIIITVVVVIFTSIFLNYYILGKRNKAIADNTLSAQQSGTQVMKTTFIVYLIAGAIVGIGAILFGAKYSTPQIDAEPGEYGKEYLIQCMVAIILGGMPITGGAKSKISAVVVGSFTLRILYEGLNIFVNSNAVLRNIGLSAVYQFVQGVIFLVLVTMVIRQPKHIKALPA